MATKLSCKPIKTVLLVDENEILARTLHNYLERKGFNMLEARSGEEALLIAECHPSTIHVIVTDIVMPRINGHELVESLLPLRPETQVIMTSEFPEAILAQQDLTPLVPLLRKPFTPKRLLTRIEEVLMNPQFHRTLASLAPPLPHKSLQQPHLSSV